MNNFGTIHNKIKRFETIALGIFSNYEDSKARIVTVTLTKDRIQGLSIKQENLLMQAISCLEHDLYKAAHVMAWAAFIDYLEMQLSEDNLQKVHKVRPKWEKYKTIEELRENIPEYQLLDVAKEIKLINKTANKSLQGLLSKRNECAHPSDYEPELNESLGFISELLKRIQQIKNKAT